MGGGLVWLEGEVVAPTPDHVFTPAGAARIAVFDERTGALKHELSIHDDPYQLVYGDGALVVADLSNGRLFTIDRSGGIRTLRTIRRLDALMAVTHGAVWVVTTHGLLRRIEVAGV